MGSLPGLGCIDMLSAPTVQQSRHGGKRGSLPLLKVLQSFSLNDPHKEHSGGLPWYWGPQVCAPYSGTKPGPRPEPSKWVGCPSLPVMWSVEQKQGHPVVWPSKSWLCQPNATGQGEPMGPWAVPLRKSHPRCQGAERVAGSRVSGWEEEGFTFSMQVGPIHLLTEMQGLQEKGWASCGSFKAPWPVSQRRVKGWGIFRAATFCLPNNNQMLD